jgi:uncharacterized protein (DUF2336 family)
MPQVSSSLIAELETAVSTGSSEVRTKMLRQVTDLFLGDADRLNDEQIKVFDDVLVLLIDRIETKALAELSERLAPVDNAPLESIRKLARDEKIAVAGPVLTESRRLSAADLTEIAQTRGQEHLLAISGRAQLEESVTDVLLDRGNRDVVFKLASNTGARFSETGFGTLVKKSEGDDGLAEKVGSRLDMPARLLRELLARATEAVRARIMALVPAEKVEEVRRIIADIGEAIGSAQEHNFTDAELLVRAMHENGTLNERALRTFALEKKYEEMTVALALLSGAPVRATAELMDGLRNDALLIPCKAANLTWPTVEAILRNRHPGTRIHEEILRLAQDDFSRLSVATAQRTLRFAQIRQTVK